MEGAKAQEKKGERNFFLFFFYMPDKSVVTPLCRQFNLPQYSNALFALIHYNNTPNCREIDRQKSVEYCSEH